MKFIRSNAGILEYKEDRIITLEVSITEVAVSLKFVDDPLTYHFPLGSSEWSAYYQNRTKDGGLGGRKLCEWDHCYWVEHELKEMLERTPGKKNQEIVERALKVVRKLKEAKA
jgi:hypothetical protein